ncbi:MAG TPA: 3-deoxy-D-manno-octulosonic acid transferase [Stellaceae bacterium]|nr:3-deoxy-D-manno-octulosonic acid transferase [Stellaceae bacterium]
MSLWPLYRVATMAAAPLASFALMRRAALGKEERARIGERWGRASRPRPAGRLVWLHAASVGEAVSLLPLVERFLVEAADLSVLVTTGTVTSAAVIAERLPAARAWHQYVPIDHPGAVRRFLEHWRPDLAIWVESEFWPNLLLETRRRGVRMALVNARMSEASWRGWRRAPRSIRRLLGCFDVVLAQDARQGVRLRALGASPVETAGDLKAAAAIPPVPTALLEEMRQAVGGRPTWLAASTHDGEEAMVATAHGAVRGALPDLLTILAPRHPARAQEIQAVLQRAGLGVARRSLGEVPGADTDVWLIDTLGEMGLFYRLAPLVLVAGSLRPQDRVGGHNPLEAAVLGCAVLHGPDTANCAASTRALDEAGGARLVRDAPEIAAAVEGLLRDRKALASMGEAAAKVAAGSRGVVDAVFGWLEPLLPDSEFNRK